MAERLLLEGSDLAELMTQVRAEFGPHAKIVAAERVRSGGFAGFFARERYELTVDVPEMPPARPLRSRRPPPPSLDDLLAAADAADAAPDRSPAAPYGPAPHGSAPHGPVPDAAPARAAIDAQPTLAAQAATPRAATAGHAFATVLDQVRSLAGDEPAFAPLAPPRAVEPAPSGTVPTQHPPVGAPLAVPASLVAAGPAAAVITSAVAPAVAPAVVPAPAAAAGAAAPVVEPAAPEPAPIPAAAAPRIVRSGALRAALGALGVPAALLAVDPLTLSAVLDQVPPAPPLPHRPGEVLAVVGGPGDLAAVEPLLRERMRLAISHLVRTGYAARTDPTPTEVDHPVRASSVAALSAWRSRAGQASHAWLVQVAVEADADSRAEAAQTLAASRATQVWAVVDARTRTEDLRRWLAQVGAHRPVDGLIVRALADTTAPGALLGLGPPVAWLDGLPASRLVWAAALGQPLDAALA